MTGEMKREFILMVIIGLCMVSNINAKQQVPCFFIFGDSLADNGNNNLLSTSARANYHPYGIDFQVGPTGRFTNGKTTVDILGDLLGFDNYIPSFAQATNNIREGINYASGSAGILKKTGTHLGDNVFFGDQLKNHKRIIARLGVVLGSQRKAKRHLRKCLYWAGLGSNDYINNYFAPHYYNSSKHRTPEQFASHLIDQYWHKVKKLYKYGARKVALSGIGRIGCTPSSISQHEANKSTLCVEFMNEAVQHFNVKLLRLVDQFNSNVSNAKFIYINSYGMGGGDPSAVGFTEWSVGCCPLDKLGQCDPNRTPCKNRNEYVFWDSFHPTERLNMITASRVYNAYDLSDAYPMDVNQLVHWSPRRNAS